ncbi:hypothetical protein IDSA_04200 [Pseudidiomarina salinarum]|uniref:Uncharacterized protein n=1 Tax=Pseudidiomarina salinarum TaxID=435908 RepID=A0A094LAM9_9GAMM|nr:DsrE family protein [Pseudidiomarina salinarum]KFZ31888.1 hypothetical protein IDSA_04200 [Pseudidiomarina salinarum]RUO70337.1 hypothetical protein CWI79_02385 [Pseudidiomarina salinarum]
MARLVLALHSFDDSASSPSYRSLLAYHYAQAAVASGHQIDMVFFYQSGVRFGGADEKHPLTDKWLELSAHHNIPLVLCATVAETEYSIGEETLRPGFHNGGLTEFAQATALADQVVQF